MNITHTAKDLALQEVADNHRCPEEIANILESDGYIEITHTNTGNLYEITTAGKAFIAQGGYTSKAEEAERQKREAEAAKEKDRQDRLQATSIQKAISLELMKIDHEFQAKQNKANRKSNFIAAFISAIVSFIVALVMQTL